MAGLRPGGFSDDDCSDEDEFGYDAGIKPVFSASQPYLPPEPPLHSNTRGGFDVPPVASTVNGHVDSTRNMAGLTGGTRGRHSSRKPFGDRNVPAVWSSTTDDLVNLDDFRIAVTKNQLDAIERFLAHGIDVNSVFSSGWGALMYAAHQASPECVDCLLRHGADANANKDGYTVLMAACGSTCSDESVVLDCVNKLLKAEADVNAFDRNHMCALMYAAREGRAMVVDVLIPLTTDINTQNNKGYTALMWAATGGHSRTVSALLSANADPKIRKADGKTAVELAAARGHSEVLRLLGVLPAIDTHDPGETPAVVSKLTHSPDVIPSATGSSEWIPRSSSTSSAFNAVTKSQPIHPSTSAVSVSSAASAPAAVETSIVTFGELELFLSGLDLARLIPIFQQQRVSFTTFLRLSDSELLQMGIDQIGVRKRILDAIRETHKKNWETSSLASLQYNKKICCSEAVVMLANIKQHAAYIASTIGYVDDQILADNKIVLDAPQEPGISVKDLCINTEEAMVNVRNLYIELSSLRKRLEKICHNRDFQPPELVSSRRKRTRGRRFRRGWRLAFFGVFVAGCTTAFLLLGKNAQR